MRIFPGLGTALRLDRFFVVIAIAFAAFFDGKVCHVSILHHTVGSRYCCKSR